MKFEIPYTNWIWVQDWNNMDQHKCWLVHFRKTFSVAEIPDKLMIRISADSRYKLYVNGSLIEVGPVKGDRFVWYYDEIDIAPYLNAGENVVGVDVLRYPLEHVKGNHGIFRTEYPGLFLEECEKQFGISADRSWKYYVDKHFEIVSESMFFAPLQILEKRNGDKDLHRWLLPGYDDSRWHEPSVYTDYEIPKAVSPRNLYARPIPSIICHDVSIFHGIKCMRGTSSVLEAWNAMLKGSQSVQIPAGTEKIVEIDAGEEMTGYLSLRMAKGAGADITILCAESYVVKENDSSDEVMMRLPKKGDRTDSENGILHGFEDHYSVEGFGTAAEPESFEPFWFRTFRYVQLRIKAADEPIVITGFDYIKTGYPLEVKTTVETSDPSLASVWDISLRTLQRCMHETYEDCPFYEQLQYAMDSRSQILYTYSVSGDDRLARKCMDDFRRSQRNDGMINCSYPCYGPNVIPGFSIYYVMMLYDHMMYFGDKELLRKHMGCVDGIMEYFRRNLDERGLVGKNGGINGKDRYWSFIDWTSQWDATSGVPAATLKGPITMESLLYIYGLTHAAKILRYLDRDDTANEYESRAEEVKRAVNTYCRDKDGFYIDGPGVYDYSQHCQVFAVLTDTISAEEGRRYVLASFDDKEKFAQCSVAMAFYLYRALEKIGAYEKTDECWNLWREMVKNNLTTCVEDGVGQRSDCHAWGALALYELPSVVLGVEPAEPGYRTVRINPQKGYFTWAKGDVITKCGMVHVEWYLDEQGNMITDYQAPEGCEVIRSNP